MIAPECVITLHTRVAPCCMRRARARYWRLARAYAACGAILGLAVGMVLGALSVPR